VAVEKRGQATGRVRMNVIPDFKASTIIPVLTRNVAPGSTIYTDGLKSFAGLVEAGLNISLASSRSARNFERCEVRRPPCGSSHRQPPGVAHWHLPRCEQGPTPGITLLGLGTGRKSTEYEQIRGARDLNHNRLGVAEATR
jgi:hypothetical protein